MFTQDGSFLDMGDHEAIKVEATTHYHAKDCSNLERLLFIICA